MGTKEQSITIRIADHDYHLKVTSEEQEEVIRKAAEDIRKKLNFYQEKYPSKRMVDHLSLVALNVSIMNMTLQQQHNEMAAAEETLARELTGYLDNIDKNSR